MKQGLSAQAYIQLLKARIGACRSIEPEDRHVPARPDSRHRLWILCRGGIAGKNSLFEGDALAQQPLRLLKGGNIELNLRIRQRDRHKIELASYRLAFLGLPDNDNSVSSLRYDQSEGQRRGEGWDDEIGDNP